MPEHLFDPTKGVAPRHALAHAHAHAHATIGLLFRRPNRTEAHSCTEDPVRASTDGTGATSMRLRSWPTAVADGHCGDSNRLL